jgi:hypothetical protein
MRANRTMLNRIKHRLGTKSTRLPAALWSAKVSFATSASVSSLWQVTSGEFKHPREAVDAHAPRRVHDRDKKSTHMGRLRQIS